MIQGADGISCHSDVLHVQAAAFPALPLPSNVQPSPHPLPPEVSPNVVPSAYLSCPPKPQGVRGPSLVPPERPVLAVTYFAVSLPSEGRNCILVLLVSSHPPGLLKGA